jgi:hypothetical protein
LGSGSAKGTSPPYFFPYHLRNHLSQISLEIFLFAFLRHFAYFKCLVLGFHLPSKTAWPQVDASLHRLQQVRASSPPFLIAILALF